MNRKTKRIILVIVMLFVLVPVLLTGNSSAQPKIERQAFRDSMRKLWKDHSELTRSFMTSTLGDLPNQSETAESLLQNQNEIGTVFKPYYGEAAGIQLAELLREHALIEDTMLQAARRADPRAFEDSVVRWYANADEIADFLSDLNPENWPPRQTRSMMKEYLDLTLEEALAHWSGDSAADEAAHFKVQNQALKIADVLSEGIINKFREKFK
jgi:hypothetical protein